MGENGEKNAFKKQYELIIQKAGKNQESPQKL
jgi:hypothetical protein